VSAKRTWQTLCVIFLLALQLPVGGPTAAAPLLQETDPVVQCAEGVQLYLDGQAGEALPLLEAGFAGRDGINFDNLDDRSHNSLIEFYAHS
jgi:hypothetical protein